MFCSAGPAGGKENAAATPGSAAKAPRSPLAEKNAAEDLPLQALAAASPAMKKPIAFSPLALSPVSFSPIAIAQVKNHASCKSSPCKLSHHQCVSPPDYCRLQPQPSKLHPPLLM